MDSSWKSGLLLTDSGRSAWYDAQGVPRQAFVVGIAGGSSSGKTSVANAILRSLNVPWILGVSQDSFYKTLTPDQSKLAFDNQYDFDSPNSQDHDALLECIKRLKGLKSCNIPVYSFVQHQRLKETQYLYGGNIIIVEGILALHDPRLRELMDVKIFVQCDSDLMLARRIKRDIVERGRDVAGILDQYLRFVKPSYDDFIRPTSRHADLIVPGSDNAVAIDLITTHIRMQLEKRNHNIRPQLAPGPGLVTSHSSSLPPNIHVMTQTNRLREIYTVLRDCTTSKDDFIFFTGRLANLLIEEALSLLPFIDVPITTRGGYPCAGKKLDTEYLSALTILRSGEVLERGLRRALRDAPLGSALIQSDREGEPLLYSLDLPKSLRNRETASKATVLVLDSQIGTGAAALMAIRILLDHDVKEENIILVVMLLCRNGGIASLLRAFPGIRVVTSAIDDGLQERWVEHQPDQRKTRGGPSGKKIWAISPGFGSFDDRFFGCQTDLA